MMARFCRASLWALSIFAAASFVGLGALRLVHPPELDPIEGVTMDHVVRLAEGRPIYVKPSLDFVPLAEMPGYPALTSLLARAFGPRLWEPRLISLLAALLIAALAFRIVWSETQHWTLGAAAAGLMLATSGLTGGRYDVARPDSLAMALSLAGLTALRFTDGIRGALAAALLLSLGCFTQLHAAWFLPAAAIHLWVADRRRLFPFLLGVAVVVGGGVWVLSRGLGPWFGFFAWEIPLRALRAGRIASIETLARALIGTLGLLTLPALLALVLPIPGWRGKSGLWTWAALGGLGAGLMAAFEPRGLASPLVPTAVIWSVAGPISLARVVGHLTAWPGSERMGRSSAVYLALVLQFVPLAGGLQKLLPAAEDRLAHAELTERLRRFHGKVMLLGHGFYAWQAGKGMSLQPVALDAVMAASGGPALRSDPEFFRRMLAPLEDGRDRPAIVADRPLDRVGGPSRSLWQTVARSYRAAGPLGAGRLFASEQDQPDSYLLYLPSSATEGASERADSSMAAAPGTGSALSSH
jgi:4-amino-4-deoxy-L-arabinose transferase-like glycosyltransferase